MCIRYLNLVFTAFAVIATATSTATASPTVNLPKAPQTNSCSVGASVVLSVSAVTANPPLSYQWLFNDTEIPGANTRTLTLTNVQTLAAGTYAARVSDADGHAMGGPFTVDVDPTFTKITSSPVLNPGNSAGVAWVDFNNDGWLDLFVASNPMNLFSNRSGGDFFRVSGSVLPSANANSSGVWGDYDNDGFPDLYVANNQPYLFHNVGGTKFVQVTTNIAGKGGTYGFGAWADYDRDGHLDLFVSSGFTKAANTLFHNRGGGDFVRETKSIVVHDVPQFSEGAAWGDYDNDGWPDLFVANGRDYNNGGRPQKSYLYHNLGHGTFEKITNGVVAETLGGMASGVWGDYDNDGFPDLFVCGYENGSSPQRRILYHNDGHGGFTLVTDAGPIVTESGYDQGCAWVDYDNDGYLDLFITSGGPNAFKDTLYHNEGDGTFTKVTRGSLVNDGGEGAGCAWGDFNNDGFQDLYVSNFQNQTTEKNALYLNHPNGNSWITLRCQGRVSNRSAIGTKVRVKATIHGKETWQMREISSNGGYYSQTSLNACFGLGDADHIDLIRLEWPSGIVQTITNPQPRQILTVVEPSRVQAAMSPSTQEIQLTVLGGRGLIYDLDRSPDLSSWETIGSVTNLTGSASYVTALDPQLPVQVYRARER